MGSAWAEEAAKQGMNIIICARRLAKLEAVATNIRATYGVEVRVFTVDIAREDGADKIIEQIQDLDIGLCVYNAAFESGGYFINVEEETNVKQILGNTLTPMRLSYYLCREMARKHRGCIVLISSMAGVVGTANQAVYSGCKSFMALLAESLWYEMGQYGVTVTGVTVGTVATPEFFAIQEAQGTNLEVGKSVDYSDLLDGITIDPALLEAKPHTPEEVVSYVVEHLEDGPRLFSHPEDEAAFYGYTRMNRKDAVLFMGRNTDKYFSAYPQANEFTKIKKM